MFIVACLLITSGVRGVRVEGSTSIARVLDSMVAGADLTIFRMENGGNALNTKKKFLCIKVCKGMYVCTRNTLGEKA